MKSMRHPKEQGFALIITMLVLLILTILVVNTVRSNALGEKTAGNYMDRGRAMQAAEQALRQGEALLLTNGLTCVDGCSVAGGVVAPSNVKAIAMPSVWSDAGATNITIAANQLTAASFQIVQLANTLGEQTKIDSLCVPYSIMGRGVGLDNRAVVVLQAVAYVCPI